MAVIINKLITGSMGVGASEVLDLTKTRVKYTVESGLSDWEGDIIGELTSSSIPNIRQAETIDTGNTVTSIGYRAFINCSKMTSITIPNGMTSIGEEAFSNCTGLTSVTIPNSVTSIGTNAFNGCLGIVSFTVGDGNVNYKSVNNLLLSKDGKTLIRGINGNVTIPNGVTNIMDYAFYFCTGLTNVTIPDSVTHFGEWAFMYCESLTNITIPSSVTYIGSF